MFWFGPPGPPHDNPRNPTCTFQGPDLQKHQNSTERHREKKKWKWWREREKKKREILGPPPFEAPPRPHFLWLGPTFVPPPPLSLRSLGAPPRTPDPKMDWPNLFWPKLATSGWPKKDWPKSVSSEQGNPLMPLLFALAQHSALVAVFERLQESEFLFPFLDDLHIKSHPNRTVGCLHIMRQELWNHSKISLNHGKTRIWNKGGFFPPGCEALQEAARVDDLGAVVWKGDCRLPLPQQGIRILGIPLGAAGVH